MSSIIDKFNHRSYEAQGIDKIPTVHLGAGACAIEKKGKKTDRGLLNLQIEIKNANTFLVNMRQEMEENKQYIIDTKDLVFKEWLDCRVSEACKVTEKDDYISFLGREVERRNVNAMKMKVTDELSRLYIAKRNQEILQQVMDEMKAASDYVHEHGLYPSGWNNIIETYYLLKQQEEQEKQKSESAPVESKKDKPAKSTGLRHH